MKLPWDKNYLKISFHVMFTILGAYILISLFDGLAYIIIDIGGTISGIFDSIGRLVRLFSPLIIAFIIAYLFDPLVDFYQKHYTEFKSSVLLPRLKNKEFKLFKFRKKKEPPRFKTRGAGAALCYISIFFGLYLIIRLLVASLHFDDDGITGMINRTMETFTTLIVNLEDPLREWGVLDFAMGHLETFILWVNNFIFEFISGAITTIVTTGVWILNMFISLIVAFYFMTHKERLKSQLLYLVKLILPKKASGILLVFLEDLHIVFSGYIRGLILDGIILGTLIAIGLSIVGVEMAIPIGILTAIFNLIPYFGGIMAFFLSITFELLLGTPINALYAAIVILIIQQIDTVFIVPRVIGHNVKLSAPVVLLSLTIAGSLFGIMGMLLIVPILATIKIIAMRFLERYAQIKHKKGEI